MNSGSDCLPAQTPTFHIGLYNDIIIKSSYSQWMTHTESGSDYRMVRTPTSFLYTTAPTSQIGVSRYRPFHRQWTDAGSSNYVGDVDVDDAVFNSLRFLTVIGRRSFF
jgi:hypothetical protein